MTQDQSDLIEALAKSFSIDPLWVKAIIAQESSWNTYAIRSEMSYHYLFHPEIYSEKLGLSLNTEMSTQKMSWGLGQLMGATLRELGFEDCMGKQFIPEVNIQFICMYIERLSHVSKIPDDIFAMYNGGEGAHRKIAPGKYRNQNYVDSVNRYLQKLKT